jgi:RNA polymerase sigma-70 factor (ECF subfamily)
MGEPLHHDDLKLAKAAAANDPKAIAALDAGWLTKLKPAIAHLGDDAFCEEVLQRLRVSLLTSAPGRPAKIADYSGRGELLRWLRASAVRTALNLRTEGKASREDPVGDELAELPFTSSDPQLEAMRKQYGEKFRSALRHAVKSLPAEARVELKQYYFEGLGVEELGGLYQVAPSTISRRLAKSRELLAERTRDALREQLGISGTEVESILRLIIGQLELTRSAFEPGGTIEGAKQR